MEVIQLDSMSVSYGKLLALNDISLNLTGGSVGLLGPNGAGKTTLLKTLLGFLTPDAGSGAVLDMDIRTQQLDIRQRVGYMPENDCHIPEMDAVRFVAYVGELCGMPREDAIQRAHEVLQYVGLGEARYRTLQTYSTGMKQRIKLAQALIHSPELLFLDEPTNGMDPTGRQDMLELIKDISTDKGIHVVLSSHLLPDVEYACQDVVVLHQGKLVIQGNIEELKSENRKLYEVKIKVKDLFSSYQRNCDENLDEIFTKAIEKFGCEWRKGEGDMLRVALPDGIEPEIFFKVAAQNGFQIRHLVAVQYSLEDVFAQAVGE